MSGRIHPGQQSGGQRCSKESMVGLSTRRALQGKEGARYRDKAGVLDSHDIAVGGGDHPTGADEGPTTEVEAAAVLG